MKTGKNVFRSLNPVLALCVMLIFAMLLPACNNSDAACVNETVCGGDDSDDSAENDLPHELFIKADDFDFAYGDTDAGERLTDSQYASDAVQWRRCQYRFRS